MDWIELKRAVVLPPVAMRNGCMSSAATTGGFRTTCLAQMRRETAITVDAMAAGSAWTNRKFLPIGRRISEMVESTGYILPTP